MYLEDNINRKYKLKKEKKMKTKILLTLSLSFMYAIAAHSFARMPNGLTSTMQVIDSVGSEYADLKELTITMKHEIQPNDKIKTYFLVALPQQTIQLEAISKETDACGTRTYHSIVSPSYLENRGELHPALKITEYTLAFVDHRHRTCENFPLNMFEASFKHLNYTGQVVSSLELRGNQSSYPKEKHNIYSCKSAFVARDGILVEISAKSYSPALRAILSIQSIENTRSIASFLVKSKYKKDGATFSGKQFSLKIKYEDRTPDQSQGYPAKLRATIDGKLHVEDMFCSPDFYPAML